MNRRDLMKFFAAGTVIAPLGSAAVAKLIEVPNIEPVKLATVIDPEQIKSFSVNLEMLDGSVKTLPCKPNVGVRAYDRPLAGDISLNVRIGAVTYLSPSSNKPIVELWGDSKA